MKTKKTSDNTVIGVIGVILVIFGIFMSIPVILNKIYIWLIITTASIILGVILIDITLKN